MMLVTYIEYLDHASATDSTFEDHDLDKIRPMLMRMAGIVLDEMDDYVILGEVAFAEDNPILDASIFLNAHVIISKNIVRRVNFWSPEEGDSEDERSEGSGPWTIEYPTKEGSIHSDPIEDGGRE
jgi:hypothetical protein